MNPECPCQHCNAHLEFEEEAAGKTIVCPQCGMETVLFVPAVDVQTEPQPQLSKPTTKKALKSALRKQTAYPFGRGLVNIYLWLSIIAVPATLCLYYKDETTAQLGGLDAWPHYHNIADTEFGWLLMAVGNIPFALLFREIIAAGFDMADAALKRLADSK
jgi:hypothetical protein